MRRERDIRRMRESERERGERRGGGGRERHIRNNSRTSRLLAKLSFDLLRIGLNELVPLVCCVFVNEAAWNASVHHLLRCERSTGKKKERKEKKRKEKKREEKRRKRRKEKRREEKKEKKRKERKEKKRKEKKRKEKKRKEKKRKEKKRK
jgi:hypothetical protein